MKWCQKTWVTVLFLLFFFPIGLYLMWKYRTWGKAVKVIISILCILSFIIYITPPKDNVPATTTPTEYGETSPETEKEETEDVSGEDTDEQVNESAPQEQNSETMGQKNARAKAKSYLSVTAFSYSGLITQLEFEGFSTKEATYAADNCGADWNEQAAKKAETYLSISSFSRSGLIDQLEFEGFTSEQAEYGVKAVGY